MQTPKMSGKVVTYKRSQIYINNELTERKRKFDLMKNKWYCDEGRHPGRFDKILKGFLLMRSSGMS